MTVESRACAPAATLCGHCNANWWQTAFGYAEVVPGVGVPPARVRTYCKRQTRWGTTPVCQMTWGLGPCLVRLGAQVVLWWWASPVNGIEPVPHVSVQGRLDKSIQRMLAGKGSSVMECVLS